MMVLRIETYNGEYDKAGFRLIEISELPIQYSSPNRASIFVYVGYIGIVY